MSSKYPILDNRPIDQWKVTELKEELKRRKLTIKGLKDDLIRRLDEALRIEQEVLEAERENSTTVDDDNGLNLNSQPVNKNETQLAEVKNAEAVPVTEMVEHVDNIAIKNEKLDDVKVHVDINDSIEAVDEEILQEEVKLSGINTSSVEGELNVPAASMEIDPENVIAEIGLNRQDAQNSETQEVNENIQLENEKPKPQLEIVDAKPQLENEGLKHPPEEVMLDSSAPNNQVSEVTANLGFQVKCDSISTDSVSINEKIELKDNIIADNVKLELDVKPEMVEPSSSNVVAVSGESHPVDVEEPREKQPSVEEKDDNYATNADLSKKIECVDVGYSEKLNLDRSSGDDSMEEDVLESKQVDSKYNPDEVGGRSEKSVMPSVNEENVVDIVGKHLSTDQKRIHMENKIHPSVPVEKRKLNEQESMGSTEQLKRQRRWNSENIKIPEPQSSNIAPTTTPKDAFQHTPLRRNFSRSDSTASEDTPKERVVPPSQKPPTNSLRIDRFVRPFTLKAVQELLGKTGTVTSFWMDHIKTHCYVTYSSVEEAVETRNAVYNLQWPTNGGRLLVAEFVEPQEVKARLEAPPHSPATPVTPIALTPAALSTQQLQPSPRQQLSRQQLPPPPPLLPPPPPLSNPPLAKERIAHPPPPVLPEKHDPPIVTLDDLFRKTKATPRIYYLPLAEEQVAAKLAQQGKSTKQ